MGYTHTPPRNAGWKKGEKNISLKIMEPKTQTTYYFSGPLGMGPASPSPRGHSSRTSLGTGGSSSLLSPAWVEVKDLPNNSWGCQRSSNNAKTIPRGSLDTISGVWQEKESQTIFFFQSASVPETHPQHLCPCPWQGVVWEDLWQPFQNKRFHYSMVFNFFRCSAISVLISK